MFFRLIGPTCSYQLFRPPCKSRISFNKKLVYYNYSFFYFVLHSSFVTHTNHFAFERTSKNSSLPNLFWFVDCNGSQLVHVESIDEYCDWPTHGELAD